MRDAETRTFSAGLSELKEFAERICNHVLIAGSYGLRGGLGFDGNLFSGPNFALKEASKGVYTLMIYQMWTLNAESHSIIGKDEVEGLLLGAREWFDEHVPPDKR